MSNVVIFLSEHNTLFVSNRRCWC